ncbi:hypothetical protein Fcan01_00195 [Folsomia candida]|uniref:Uncharacterized protein n=1 Tax=Folsomia candida TaxID=158441 RepID=A0A226F5D9_FOLCA|nr:hypothetical protein Fcan01_00195 [Folsomia candida]
MSLQCRLHLKFDFLHSENLPTTNQIPVTLTKQKVSKYEKTWHQPFLDLFRTKGWICECILIKVSPKAKNYFEELPEYWYNFHVTYYLRQSRHKKESGLTLHRNFGVIVFADNSKIPKNFEGIIYLTSLSQGAWDLIAGLTLTILYLPKYPTQNYVTICVRIERVAKPPNLNNFECRRQIFRNSPSFPVTRRTDSFWGVEFHITQIDLHLTLVNMYMLNTALALINASSAPRNVPVLNETFYQKLEKQGSLRIRYPAFYPNADSAEDPPGNGHNDYILLGSKDINFLTCYSVPKLTFNLYADPFPTSVWILLIISITTFTLLLDTYSVRWLKIRGNSNFLFFIGSFLEETSSLDRKLEKSAIFRLGIGPWILVSMILSTVYVAQILNSLNSPLPTTHISEFKTFACSGHDFDKKLLNHTGYYELLFRLAKFATKFALLQRRNRSILEQTNCFAVLSSPSGDPNARGLMTYWWTRKLTQLTIVAHKNALGEAYYKLMSSFISIKQRYYPKSLHGWDKKVKITRQIINSAVEEELVACGKSVYVGTGSHIADYKTYLEQQYPFRTFYTGSAPIFAEMRWWSFSCSKDSKILKYFRLFIESGIHQWYAAWQEREGRKEKLVVSKGIKRKVFVSGTYWELVKRLYLQTSVQTLFQLCAGFLAVAGGVFVYERFWRVVRYGVPVAWFRMKRKGRKIIMSITNIIAKFQGQNYLLQLKLCVQKRHTAISCKKCYNSDRHRSMSKSHRRGWYSTDAAKKSPQLVLDI